MFVTSIPELIRGIFPASEFNLMRCIHSIPPPPHVQAGLAASFMVTARDRFGNANGLAGIYFFCTFLPAGPACTQTDNGDGTYSLSYTLNVAGAKPLSVSLVR